VKFLAVDAGNTSIHFAFYERNSWRGHAWVSTRLAGKDLRRFLSKRFARLMDTEVFIASVVPPVNALLREFFKKKINVRTRFIGDKCPVPMINRYRYPKQVGVDRLLSALGAYHRFRRELVVIDFGTAITFDVVSRRGEYLGGVIAPGIEISLEALFQKTALLPRIVLKHPKNVIGRDTTESIRVGCSVGIGGLCDRLVEVISKARRVKPMVIATGGYAHFMKKYCRSIKAIHPNLILDGIRLTAFNKG
jgi:type III pantothenate kinase